MYKGRPKIQLRNRFIAPGIIIYNCICGTADFHNWYPGCRGGIDLLHLGSLSIIVFVGLQTFTIGILVAGI